ncbi:MAG: methyltransferase [Lysobacter sp.]
MTILVDTLNPIATMFDVLGRMKERTLLIDGERRWSAGQLLEAGRRAAAWMRARGVRAGTPLIWEAEDSAHILPARLAALQLGAVWSQHSDGEVGAVRIGVEDVAALAQHSPAIDLIDDPISHSIEPPVPPTAPFDGAPINVVVLLPLTGRGGEIALAAWHAGACVHVSAQTSAAKTLAWLERSSADHVALSGSALRSLLIHPSLALSDLSALRRWLCENAGPDDHELARKQSGCELEELGDTAADLATQIGERLRLHSQLADVAVTTTTDGSLVAFVVPGHRDGNNAQPYSDLQDLTANTVEAVLAGIDLQGAIAATEALSRTALHSMLGALQHCGLFASPEQRYDAETVLNRARVAAPHRRLIRRWLKVLSEQGLLEADDNGYRLADAAPDCGEAAMRAAWDTVERDWRASAEAAGTIQYARRNAERLPELIAGELNAVHLLFPEGRSDLARALYRESIAARYQHHSIAALVAELARRSERPLRLLEVGAGTGATSQTLLPALDGRAVDYLYTDVSRYFIEQAAERFGDIPRLRFGLYDIDRPGREQGYASQSFDLIVAGGVLNAARNTDASLRWLGELLRPGGWLLLTEPTVEEFWVMASQALMLVDADDERADSQATFLSWPQWRQALDQAGFERMIDLPPPQHPLQRLGHRVFAAQIKRGRHAPQETQLREHLGALSAATGRIESLDALPLNADGATDLDLLRRWASQPAAPVLSSSDLRGTR